MQIQEYLRSQEHQWYGRILRQSQGNRKRAPVIAMQIKEDCRSEDDRQCMSKVPKQSGTDREKHFPLLQAEIGPRHAEAVDAPPVLSFDVSSPRRSV